MDERSRAELLVVRSQLGERASFAQLVHDWHQPVWNYLRRMLGPAHSADDVSQDVWLAVLRGLPRLRTPDRFVPWLFTIARRAVLNQLRATYAEPIPADVVPDTAAEDPADAALDRAVLVRWLSALPLPEREVLVLFHLGDLSLDECAEVLGIPVGTVKSRLFRARRAVRATAAAEGER